MNRVPLKFVCTLLLALHLGSLKMAFAEDEVVQPLPEDVQNSGDESFDEEGDFGDEVDQTESDANKEVQAEEEKPVEEKAPEEQLEPVEEKEPVVEEEKAAPVEEPKFEEPAVDLHAEAPPSNEPAPDEPDITFESKLHDIFLQFYNAKTPEAEWQTLVGSRNAERYRIQNGDNLWNISQTIFGDGHYWPKVWSLNKDITNPHLISPNNSIRFLLGDESEPPAFTVTENATETTSVTEEAPAEPGPLSEAVSNPDEPEIPPPTKVSRPVVKKIPPSLPEWQEGTRRRDDYDETGIDYGRRHIVDVQDTIPLTSYVADEAPQSMGTVTEIEVGHKIASALQYIYVTMKPGVGNVGDSFLALSNTGAIQSVDPSITGFLGNNIEVQGEIQLVERVNKNFYDEDVETYRALVLKIINPVRVGAILTVGKIENVSVTEDGPRSQVVSQIIGGSFFTARRVYGSESIVYLNRGEKDGLEVGQILPIRANRSVRDPHTEIESNIRPVGWLRVVKTTPSFSTAVIVRAWADVLSGDLTGSGEILPSIGMTGLKSGAEAKNIRLSDEFDADQSAEIEQVPAKKSKSSGDDDVKDDLDDNEDFGD